MRLIDADELKEHVWRDKLNTRELISDLVDKQPTIDAVEVVRCKDCIYNDRGWCGSQEYGTRHVGDNDYCSYGENKDGEKE